MTSTWAAFDVSFHLDDEETIAAYLAAAADDANPEVLVAALGDVAKARRTTQIADEEGSDHETP